MQTERKAMIVTNAGQGSCADVMNAFIERNLFELKQPEAYRRNVPEAEVHVLGDAAPALVGRAR
jgi:hypothetical protein